MAAAVATPAGPPPLTPAILKRAQEILTKSKVQVALNQAFFGTIMFGRKIIMDETIGTACMTPSGQIRINPAFLAQWNVQQGVFLVCHECLHYALMHAIRRGLRNPSKWNRACDAVINDILVDSKVGQPIPGGFYLPGSRTKTAEQVYNELPDEPEDSGGYKPGQGNNDLDEDGEQLTESEKREIETKVRIEVAKAAAVAKQAGNMSSSIEELIKEIINPRTPWHDLLERFMTNFVNGDVSWKRPNRRMLAHGLYLPSSTKVPAMGTVVFQSDESGSIGDRERAHCAGHFNSIMEKCRPEKLILLHTDTEVAKVEEFTLDDLPVQFKNYAGGGTDMTAGIDWCEANNIKPDVFVCFTDGYTPWPKQMPDFPVLWLITTDVVAPCGETISYRLDE